MYIPREYAQPKSKYFAYAVRHILNKQRIALYGPSGSGKTFLLKSLQGFIESIKKNKMSFYLSGKKLGEKIFDKILKYKNIYNTYDIYFFCDEIDFIQDFEKKLKKINTKKNVSFITSSHEKPQGTFQSEKTRFFQLQKDSFQLNTNYIKKNHIYTLLFTPEKIYNTLDNKHRLSEGIQNFYSFFEKKNREPLPIPIRTYKENIFNTLLDQMHTIIGTDINLTQTSENLNISKNTLLRFLHILQQLSHIRNLPNYKSFTPFTKETNYGYKRYLYQDIQSFQHIGISDNNIENIKTCITNIIYALCMLTGSLSHHFFEGFFFSDNKHKKYISLIIKHANRIIPIEINVNEKRNTHLQWFLEKYNLDYGLLITTSEKKEKIITPQGKIIYSIPFYSII